MAVSIYEELVASAGRFAGSVLDCAVGRHYAMVRTERDIGLAAVLDEAWEEASRRGPEKVEAALMGRPLAELIPLYLEDDPLMTVLALAALNSLFIHQGENESSDWFEGIRGKKRLGMVGYFGPIMERLGLLGVEKVIFELKPLPGVHRPEEAADLLPGCDAVLITGATFANKTIHHYWPHISPEADACIFGPSTPLAEFLLGSFTLGSSRVIDLDSVIRSLRAGQGIHEIKPYLQKLTRGKKSHSLML